MMHMEPTRSKTNENCHVASCAKRGAAKSRGPQGLCTVFGGFARKIQSVHGDCWKKALLGTCRLLMILSEFEPRPK